MQIAVVGGGIIGCAAAWRLAQRGTRVNVYDKSVLGGEASWAGAGMLAPGGEFAEDSKWGRLGVESLHMYPAMVDELERETGIGIDFRVCGALELTYTEGDVHAMEVRIAHQRRMGIPIERVSHPTALAAWYYPEEAVVNPRDVVKAMRRAGEQLGVRYLEGQAVEDPSQLPADLVILATGAWSPRGFPVKGHLLSFALEPGSLPAIVRSGHYYVLQRSNGLTIAGSDTEHVGFDRSVRSEAVAEIRAAAEKLVPELVGRPVAASWIGFRPGSSTGDPIVSRQADSNIWNAYGHYRNGILLAPVTARMLADEILPSSQMAEFAPRHTRQ